MGRLIFLKNPIQFSFLFSAAFVLFFTLSAYKPSPKNASEKVKEFYLDDLKIFQESTQNLTASLQLLEQGQADLQSVKNAFHKTKQAYKRIEYLLEYLDPDLAKSINGAPLPQVVVDEKNYLRLGHIEPAFVVFEPEGLQVIEEIIFADAIDQESLHEAQTLSYKIEEKSAIFSAGLTNQPISEKQIFESLREHLIRVMTMGITGFDSPAAGNEIQNVEISLAPVLKAIQVLKDESTVENKMLCETTENHLRKSIEYINKNTDFDSFDRLYFIREMINPPYAAITKLQNAYITLPKNALITKPVNDKALNLFSEDFLNPAYYAKQDQKELKPQMVELGRILFFDPVLSSNNQRACASCHNPEKAFTDGKEKSTAFDFKGNVSRNSPTLLNAAFSKAYFWDGRVEYLQDQVPDVVTNTFELHGSYKNVVETLNGSKAYMQLFKNAFKNESQPLTTNTINRAIASYIQSLVSLNSPFDKYMRGETNELSISAKNGFNLFMGKAACGTCHFAPVFNGTVPPKFIESEHEVLGITASSDFKNSKLDGDLGRYNFIKANELRNSFKTPTVRNAKLTAPYMHNGVYKTLEQVIDFYNEGGGVGFGLDVQNQTLPSVKLDLTDLEKKDIVAFLESLSDVSNHITAPKDLPQFSDNPSLNARKVGGNY